MATDAAVVIELQGLGTRNATTHGLSGRLVSYVDERERECEGFFIRKYICPYGEWPPLFSIFLSSFISSPEMHPLIAVPGARHHPSFDQQLFHAGPCWLAISWQ